jgi:hypothetical protein
LAGWTCKAYRKAKTAKQTSRPRVGQMCSALPRAEGVKVSAVELLDVVTVVVAYGCSAREHRSRHSSVALRAYYRSPNLLVNRCGSTKLT